jgi:hypothetical protein
VFTNAAVGSYLGPVRSSTLIAKKGMLMIRNSPLRCQRTKINQTLIKALKYTLIVCRLETLIHPYSEISPPLLFFFFVGWRKTDGQVRNNALVRSTL